MLPENLIPQSSPNDHRKYEFRVLENQAQVLMIHDPRIVMSYCAISVGVGSLLDPQESLGLAHFLEHMIFMGSDKYPSFNEYSQFISTNSGYQNAETNDTSTNFYFQIATDALQEALARTCDAICSPLFTAACMEKQIQAIDEEFILSANDEETRVDEVVKIFANSPYNRFNMGNKKTLTHNNVRDHLIQFYSQNYSSDVMSFVIFSPLSIDEIASKSLGHILQIPNKEIRNSAKFEVHRQLCYEPNISIEQIPLIKVQSIKNETTLKFRWVLPAFDDSSLYTQHIDYYIKYFLQKSDEHSLISILNDRQLGTDLTIQYQQLANSQVMMNVQIHDALQSEDSESQSDIRKGIKQIYGLIIAYLQNMMVKVDINIYNEAKYLRELKFRHAQISDIEDYVCELAVRIQKGYCLPQDIIAIEVAQTSFSEQKINQYLSHLLNPANIIITISLPKLQKKGAKKIQKYLGVEYIVDSVHHTNLKPLSKYSKSKVPKSPHLNSLIPINEQIYQDDQTQYPLRFENIHFFNPKGNKLCKGGIKLFLHNNESYTINMLFVEFMDLFSQDSEKLGNAEDVGLENYFEYESGRLSMYIFGFNELVIKILNSIGDRIEQLLDIQESKHDEEVKEMFEEAKDNFQDDIQAYYEEEMDDLTDKIRDQMLIKNSPPLSLLKKQLEKIKKNKFLEKVCDLWKNSTFQWVAVGNFQKIQVGKTCFKFQKKLKNRSVNLIYGAGQGQARVNQIQVLSLNNSGKSFKYEVRLHSPSISTSTCMVYLEAGVYSQGLLAKLQIIQNYLDEPFFSTLRTEKKLAYDLQLKIVNTRGILGLCFLVVSSTNDPESLSRHLHAFLESYLNPDSTMQRLGSEIQFFQKLKKSVKVKVSESFLTVQDLFDNICQEVMNRTFYFERKSPKELCKLIDPITPFEISLLGHEMLKNGSAEVLIVSKCHKNDYSKNKPKVSSLEQIKANSPYYEDLLANLRFSFKK